MVDVFEGRAGVQTSARPEDSEVYLDELRSGFCRFCDDGVGHSCDLILGKLWMPARPRFEHECEFCSEVFTDQWKLNSWCNPCRDTRRGVTDRPKRKMPTWVRIARHLGIYDDVPACFHCGLAFWDYEWGTVGGRLERAHVIDRFTGGLDVESNIRPLCPWCHKLQPMFEPGQEEEALIYFDRPDELDIHVAEIWQANLDRCARLREEELLNA